jgi:hypothetical protein
MKLMDYLLDLLHELSSTQYCSLMPPEEIAGSQRNTLFRAERLEMIR